MVSAVQSGDPAGVVAVGESLDGVGARAVRRNCNRRTAGEVVPDQVLVTSIEGVFVHIAQALQPGVDGGYALYVQDDIGPPAQVHPEPVGVAGRGQRSRLRLAQRYGPGSTNRLGPDPVHSQFGVEAANGKIVDPRVKGCPDMEVGVSPKQSAVVVGRDLVHIAVVQRPVRVHQAVVIYPQIDLTSLTRQINLVPVLVVKRTYSAPLPLLSSLSAGSIGSENTVSANTA